ncbi:rhodanese-like domain-containing protein [Undibacterium rugosum]|uniref:PhnD/SsuA/transferrin family substrate-binding protein n=1 Tax=Undibacterium rugosum TaxID=2762291 RepID=A0A923KZN7_9BURK|nr:rhodanese-like domain-containing protein [Undibacterium rugosum]MBC3935421.1 PhnD/SsuA/transferrin family substrate-binding protein [Undibacterium rugosum]MBR7778804.1 PhnD/SsuA/transferrin family substrate-binding protein [Undibacterium rugosum]
MKRNDWQHLLLGLTLACPLYAMADYKVLIGIDPADETNKKSLSFGSVPTQSLISTLGAPVVLKQTSDLTDVMRATRTQENDMLVGPPHVTASAISHQYQLLARQKINSEFVLIARKDISSVNQLGGKRLYLTQQDSVRAYVAKGLLDEAGLSLKSLKSVTYGKTSGAGLLALSANIADVTIASKAEAEVWMKANPQVAVVLKSTPELPSGLALMVKKSMPDAEKKKVLRWLSGSDAEAAGLGKMVTTSSADETQYAYIAALGILTPKVISGVATVGSAEVQKLAASGAVLVDTRSVKEYDQEHIKGAIHAPYVEKSLKDREFDSSLDDYSAITKLGKEKALVFYCNGPECWKSYKASVVAKATGVTKIYWYRGGMPEWRENKLPSETKN